MTVRWLVDTSAVARIDQLPVARVLAPRILSGSAGVSVVTELEVGFSARSVADFERNRNAVLDPLVPIALPFRAESRAREVQRALVERGQHRSAGVADLLVAATAELSRLVVLHYDADFDLIAEVTGQPTEWVVPRGSL